VRQSYFSSYVVVAIFSALGVLLVGLTLGIGRIIRPRNPTVAKLSTYECGVDPVGGGWSQSQIRYYIFALLFVMFDVEAVFIFPWAVTLKSLGKQALVEMVIFILILALGLVYAWRKKLLEWV
jgi:NADH-quinone oxidoreductase subunit A